MTIETCARCNQLQRNGEVACIHERSEDYPLVIVERGLLRVIICRDRIQWILQSYQLCANAECQLPWVNDSFHLFRKTLVRDWHYAGRATIPNEIRDLPERFPL